MSREHVMAITSKADERIGSQVHEVAWGREWRGATDRAGKNLKGRDIGYALAASFCEEANSVETCTVTAPDAITAFAVPNPGLPSQDSRFFQVRQLAELPRLTHRSAYFGPATFYFGQPFQPSTRATLSA